MRHVLGDGPGQKEGEDARRRHAQQCDQQGRRCERRRLVSPGDQSDGGEHHRTEQPHARGDQELIQEVRLHDRSSVA
jgi:hypothetical protein